MLFFPAGCAEVGRDVTDDWVATVEYYLAALPTALEADSLDPLRETATPEQVDRVRLYVIFEVNERNIRQYPKLLSLDIVDSVEVDADTARVLTREVWHTLYRDAQTGARVDELTEEYSSTYTVVFDGDRWLVAAVETE
jgi:hypothetical protein